MPNPSCERSIFYKMRLVLFGLSIVAGSTVPAQTPSPSSTALPEWDVVSIRPTSDHQLPDDVVIDPAGDGITITNLRVQYIIQVAYDFRRPNMVFGLPSWAISATYDVVAKVAASDLDRYHQLTHAQKLEMLRAVLVQRFKLQARFEPREFPAYNLVVSKGGSKLKPAKPGDSYGDGVKNGSTPAGANTIRWIQSGELIGQAVTLSQLTLALSGTRSVGLGRPIVDKTGLGGQYDLTLHFSPYRLEGYPAESEGGSTSENAGLSIFTALEDQLGLKLESSKAPIECLVIDHLELPTEN